MLTAAGHRALLGAVLVLGAIVVAAGADGSPAEPKEAAGPASTTSAPTTTVAPDDPTSSSAATTLPPTTLPPEVSVPVGAVGAYSVAPGESAVAGTGGLVTYTVEVEDAVGYAAEEFARIVDQTLADPRSWIGDGSVSFQRVASGGQIRIVLATPGTVDQLCLPLDTNGRFSCHQNGTVALNAERWLHGTEDWPGDIDEYRSYAVNHEVGHAIGHGHASCPGAGELAPVMMQQSKSLDGCAANGWPNPLAAFG